MEFLLKPLIPYQVETLIIFQFPHKVNPQLNTEQPGVLSSGNLTESLRDIVRHYHGCVDCLLTPLLSNSSPFSAATMNDQTIEFLWLAQKDSRVSLMTVGSDKCVFHLQILIHEAGKNGVFRDTDARDLVLWMVSTFENPALLL